MRQTISQTVIAKLQDAFGSAFKEYYNGDPWGIPRSALPCIVVTKEKSDITSGPTGMDRVAHQLKICVCVDKTDDFGKNADESGLQMILERYAEEQTDGMAGIPNSQTFSPQSIVGVLRSDETLGGYTIGNKIAIDYQVVYRQPTDTVTGEAQLTFTCDQLIQVTRVYPPI